jgi:hypothetical protein
MEVQQKRRSHNSSHPLGLGEERSGRNLLVCGLFLSLAPAKATVPLLQMVYQADAAHTSFDKYTLYSCYGVISNANTFPVALAIIFGNEDREGWTKFWKFVTRIHPCINNHVTTVITDQQEGSILAFAEVVLAAVSFCCSYHRRANILKCVKERNGEYLCMWLYNKLMNCKRVESITANKFEHSGNMQVNVLRFINAVNNYHH